MTGAGRQHLFPRSMLAWSFGLLALATGFGGLFLREVERTRVAYGVPRAGTDAQAELLFVPSGDPGFRVLRAAALWHAGRAPNILVSGRGSGGDDAGWHYAVALEAGVSPRSLWVEPRATSTRENMKLVAPMLKERGVRRVILVTHALHARRAHGLARHYWPGVDVMVETVDRPASWSRAARETMKALSTTELWR